MGLNKIFKAIKGPIYIDRYNGDESSTVVLSGMGRSGTTWVSDVINYDHSYREVYEPFAPARVKQARCFGVLPYVRPTCNDETLVSASEAILSGKVRNLWVDKSNPSFIGNRRIVKDVQTNLLLGWFHRMRPRMPIILLTRHPLAVVSSWMKLGWGIAFGGKERVYDEVLKQKELLEDYPLIRGAMDEVDDSSNFEQFILLWCVLHYVPYQQFAEGGAFLANYDELVERPELGFSKLFDYLDRPFSWEEIEGVLSRPSKTNYQKRKFQAGGGGEGPEWMRLFNKEQRKRAEKFLEIFELQGTFEL
jgi:hypothetical protein